MSQATYSPEDNKIRLYVGRVPKPEYLALRAQGWTSTPKQDCDFVATWSPERRDTALKYAEIIEDEDQGPEDRAADRAERFGEYRDKRTEEATGHADHYDSGPTAHGFQSQAKAERSAARHDRIATRATDSWSKAEYWQRRTAGVINHALFKSSPDVRMGRIKTLEAEQRKHLANIEARRKRWVTWMKMSLMTDPEKQTNLVRAYVGNTNDWCNDYKHPRPESASDYHREHGASLYSLITQPVDPITGAEACAMWLSRHSEPAMEDDWSRHYELRLAYENQMIEAAGGRAGAVEMVAGGFLGGRQIWKVNKSSVTGRVVSVHVKGQRSQGWSYRVENVTGADFALHKIDTERLSVDAYRPPTEEELADFNAEKAKLKEAAPKKPVIPLINPTDRDAEVLQTLLNNKVKAHYEAKKAADKYAYVPAFVPSTVCRITQEKYSAYSEGTYASASTKGVCGGGVLEIEWTNLYSTSGQKARENQGPVICKIRRTRGAEYMADRVIILTDKPQKPFPTEVWVAHVPKQQTELAI